MQHNREAAPDAHLAKLLMRHVELLWTSSPRSKVAPQFAPIELSFFCTRRWNYPWSKRRASICALTSVSVFIWGAFRRAVGALLSRGRRTRRKNWVKRKLASCFFFSSCILRGTTSAHGEREPREFSTVADDADYAGCFKSAVGDAVLHYLQQIPCNPGKQTTAKLPFVLCLGIFQLKYHENCWLGDREAPNFLYIG